MRFPHGTREGRTHSSSFLLPELQLTENRKQEFAMDGFLMKLIFDLLYVYLLSNYTVSKRNAPIMHSLDIKDVELMAITLVQVRRTASKMAEYYTLGITAHVVNLLKITILMKKTEIR